MLLRCLAATAALLLMGCAHSPPSDPSDPLEPVNRVVYGFNEQLDRFIARPVAKGYVAAVPSEIRAGVGNFFDNLGYPAVIAGDLFQAKFRQSGRDSLRFLMNSTIGVGGFLDPATMVGLEANDEDFGQAFGSWGIGQGWYLMLPVLGPTTNRDFIGFAFDTAVRPQTYLEDDEAALALGLLGATDTRASLLPVDGVLAQQLDRYAFVRGAYLQNRLNKVYDGNPPRALVYGDEDEEE